MAYRVVYSTGDRRNYADVTVLESGVLIINQEVGGIPKHYVSPGWWREVLETSENLQQLDASSDRVEKFVISPGPTQ